MNAILTATRDGDHITLFRDRFVADGRLWQAEETLTVERADGIGAQIMDQNGGRIPADFAAWEDGRSEDVYVFDAYADDMPVEEADND